MRYKNHFFMSYAGNKRNEVDEIYNNIDVSTIKTVIEPFCGSSAFSYFLSVKYPNKFEYVLNDNNKFLIETYKIVKDENLLKKFIDKMNLLLVGLTKETYNIIIKDDTVEGWFLKNALYSIRPGLFPLDNKKKSFDNLIDAPIIKFLRTENITLSNLDAISVVETYKNNAENLIFLDPPYLMACNDFYLNHSTNIYEYLYKNNIKNDATYMVLCLENVWIIKFLFNDNIIFEYAKKYELSKKHTTHLIISNRNK